MNFKYLFKYYKLGLFATLLVVCYVIMGLFAPYIAPYDPMEMHFADSLKSPSSTYWFGTDRYGRDVFSRIIHGTQITFLVSGVAVFISMFFGIILGIFAGYFRGKVEMIIMRSVDVMMSFPAIFLGLLFVAILGPSRSSITIALTLVYIPRNTRIVHSKVIEESESVYIRAALANGAGFFRIALLHLLPNVLPVILIQLTFIFATIILAETSLSFLGAGAPPPEPSWGNVMSDARHFLRQAPWLLIFPGLTIFTFVMSLNIIGDFLREVFDPKAKK
jgi:peptide/nickel transport system permease protein